MMLLLTLLPLTLGAVTRRAVLTDSSGELNADGPAVMRQESGFVDPRCKVAAGKDVPGYWTFGYGSNNLDQMKDRTQNDYLVPYKASLPGYHRIFAGKSQGWGGSVASVVKKDGFTAHG